MSEAVNLADVLGSVRVKSIQPIGPDEEFEGKNITAKRFGNGSLHVVPTCREALRHLNTVLPRLSEPVGQHPQYVPEVQSWSFLPSGRVLDEDEAEEFFNAIEEAVEELL